jgi:hypothetical protein
MCGLRSGEGQPAMYAIGQNLAVQMVWRAVGVPTAEVPTVVRLTAQVCPTLAKAGAL